MEKVNQVIAFKLLRKRKDIPRIIFAYNKKYLINPSKKPLFCNYSNKSTFSTQNLKADCYILLLTLPRSPAFMLSQVDFV